MLTFLSVLLLMPQSAGSAARPYTAVRVETEYRIPGEQFHKRRESTIAVRSDGSTSETIGKYRQVVDLKSMQRTVVDGKAVAAAPLTAETAAEYKASHTGRCVDDSAARTDKMLGYQVQRRYREIDDKPAGLTLQIEEWLAPDLNCLALKKEVRAGKPGGTFERTNVIEVKSVKTGEPRADLFRMPSR